MQATPFVAIVREILLPVELHISVSKHDGHESYFVWEDEFLTWISSMLTSYLSWAWL